jgi:hypothetical protein
MLTKQDAFNIVREKLDAEYDILEEGTVEKDYGWVVFPQTKAYIHTKKFEDMAIGSGGILVEKRSGRTIEFGSAYSTETNLKIYEAGYLDHDSFDLVITKVINLEEALSLLARLSIVYVKPEIESGVTWRIPKPFTKPQLRDKLVALPCKFNLGNLYFQWEALERMKNNSALKYELVANEGFRNEI